MRQQLAEWDQAGREQAAIRAAEQHLMQPWPAAEDIGAEARMYLEQAEGIMVEDGAGNRLIDGPAGMWCVNLGHRHEGIARVLYNQAMELSYCSPWYTMSKQAVELSQRLAAHAPGDLNHVFFTTGGSSAVETALRFMQFYNNVLGRPEKKRIVTRGGAYHGSTYLSASMNARPRDGDWMDQARDLVLHLSEPKPAPGLDAAGQRALTARLAQEFRDLIAREGAASIGAFVAEPVQASGGVVIAPEGYLREMRQICAEHDILYISDEVVTAFGRLGHVFASEAVFGIQPDMITFAKGVTAGYFPLGGVMISERLLERIRQSNHPEACFAHGLTYTSHPIGCAVALKVLDLLEAGDLERVRRLEPLFRARLESLRDLPIVKEVRSIGLMACVELATGKSDAASLAIEQKMGKRVDLHCQKLGLLVRPLINMCVISPPFIIDEAVIERMVAILREGILATIADLQAEGELPG
ncbi:aminotransferase [Pseudogemmobacter faecipullorum]|uniref:Aminotransferase n=1 Tax=Pseudogemmobacter faecipullorum TaxID=2755041 RepID=A0ABS8CIN6_9RHOB|nr:aminotransferase [Pseudogemmobacter faecipullorum]MCB5409263.1 aminotransferase [Pseudogemmobacter faecipullorum]